MADDTSDQHPDDQAPDAAELGLAPDEFAQLVEQMQKEEVEADDQRLSSLESFELWMRNHPALRQMQLVNSLKEIGPAILEAVKRLLGL